MAIPQQNPFQPMQGGGLAAPTQFKQYGDNMQPLKQRSGAGKFFLGNQGQYNQISNYTSPQTQAFNTLLQNALQGLQDPNAPASGLENRAMRQFNQDIVPGLAERFTSLGGLNSTGNALSSPNFASQLGQAGAGLAENLKDTRMQDILQQLGIGLTPQFETAYQPGGPGFLENAGNQIAEELISAGGSWLRAPWSGGNQKQQSAYGQGQGGMRTPYNPNYTGPRQKGYGG